MNPLGLHERSEPGHFESRRGVSRRRRLIEAAVSVVVVGLTFFVILPEIVDFDEVWSVLTHMTWLEGVSLVGAAAWNLVTYWLLMMLTLPGLTFGQAMIVTETSTAISNVLPGGPAFGMAISYSMYSSWGFDPRSVALPSPSPDSRISSQSWRCPRQRWYSSLDTATARPGLSSPQ